MIRGVAKSLDYAQPPARAPGTGFRARAPSAAATVATFLSAVWWFCFFTFGAVFTVDTHFTSKPQNYPEFRLTSWRPATTSPTATGAIQRREAILPLTLRTLRYVQLTEDGGATVETVAYHADVRWGRTTIALVATALLPLIAYYGLRRLLRLGGS
jgi:hypothetical protein